MTACVNRKHTKKVAAVVTASLVGALSLGAAPVAAVADTGIETLALSAQDAFKQGTMTEARDGQNRRLEIPADGIITVEAGKWVVPTEITPKDSDPVDIEESWVTYTGPGITAGATVTAETANDSYFKAPGTYTVTVEVDDAASVYDNAKFTTTFIVEAPADLSNATLFDNANGDNDVSDTTFTYNGNAQKIGVAVDGKVVKPGDYTIEIDQRLDANGTPVAAGTGNNIGMPVNAGTYLANIYEGSKDPGEQPKAKITFTVNRVNLSSADVFVADVDAVSTSTGTVSKVYVDGVLFDTADGDISTLVDATSGQTGKCSAIVTPTSGNKNVIGQANVGFNVVNEVLDQNDVSYNGGSFVDQTIYLSDGQSFKPERIVVENSLGEAIDPSYFTVSYKDANGNDVDAAALANPGTYTVTIRVNAEASHFAYGCENISIKVSVIGAQLNPADDIVFKYDGKVGTVFSDTYTGEDFLPQIETIVHTTWGDDLVAGTDYTVTAYKGDEKVDAIVDEGVYTVKIDIKGDDTITSGNTCQFTVTPFDLTYGLFVNGGDLTAYNWVDGTTGPTTVWYLNYTGEALEPAFELGYYTDDEGKVQTYANVDDNSGKLVWHALPAEAYTVTGYQVKDGTSWKDVDEVKDKGEYKVKFALETSNYDIARGIDDENTRNYFTVSSDRVAFADVDPNEWYAESVFQAKQLGYIRGIQNSNLYAPNAAITRADALVIISRMAGADTTYGEDWLSQNIGYVTRYSDVNENAYYAKAVAWATKVGVVHGYGDGTFRPDAQITREEFAAYLANYAQAMGTDVNVDADAVLAEFPDGGQVSDWAENVVAWAAGNDIMGNGGVINPQSQITRAEVAAMAVNYQPNGISADVIG